MMEIDDCGNSLLAQMNESLAARGKKLILAYPPTDFSFLSQEKREGEWDEHSCFADTDSALEWCENQLLQQEQPGAVRKRNRVPLRAMDIVAGFDVTEIALLESILEEIHYAARAVIIREGEAADSLFLLAAGSVPIRLRLGDGTRQKRLSTLIAGSAKGRRVGVIPAKR